MRNASYSKGVAGVLRVGLTAIGIMKPDELDSPVIKQSVPPPATRQPQDPIPSPIRHNTTPPPTRPSTTPTRDESGKERPSGSRGGGAAGRTKSGDYVEW